MLEAPVGRNGGLIFPAHKEKSQEPYKVAVGPRHRKVLKALATAKPRGQAPHEGLTDSEITFTTGLHMAAARRCELRDIGAVRRGAGRRNGSWVWVITAKGRTLLATLERQEEQQ